MSYNIEQMFNRIERKLDLIFLAVRHLDKEVHHMSAELDALTTEVQANTDAEDSAVLLLTRLTAMITAAGTDPAKLKALTDQLTASKDKLANAVVSNTPAA